MSGLAQSMPMPSTTDGVREPTVLDRLLGAPLYAAARMPPAIGVFVLRQWASLVRRLRDGRGLMAAQLAADARFIFPLGDRYWTRPILVRDEPYEPEIAWLLRAAADKPYALLDCGANMGYWSILASSAAYGRHPAVAIEASRANADLLENNARANDGRFRVVHRAVWGRSGETARLYGARHDGRSLRADWARGETRAEEVETVSLDDAADRYLPERRFPPLVKLDVEGVEIEALTGATRLFTEGALFAYEDHGRDAGHAVSRFVLDIGAVEVWTLGAGDVPRRVADLAAIAAIKTEPGHGYNFFACRAGSPWASLFEHVAAHGPLATSREVDR